MLDRHPEALEALLAESLAVLAHKAEFVTPTIYERIGRCLKGLGRPGFEPYFAQAAHKTLPTPYDLNPIPQRLDAGVFALWAGDQTLARTLLSEVAAQTRPAATWQDREQFVLACWFLRWDEDIVQRVPHWHTQDEADEEELDTHYPAYVISQLALAVLQQDTAAFAEALAVLADMIWQDSSEHPYGTTGGVSLWDVYDWTLVRQSEFDTHDA
jgi:hypothetical protein